MSVCLCVSVLCVIISCEQNLQKLRTDFDEFFGEVGQDPGTLDFGGNLDSFVDPESFSRILYLGRKTTFCSVSPLNSRKIGSNRYHHMPHTWLNWLTE